jgi:hypothetical protein
MEPGDIQPLDQACTACNLPTEIPLVGLPCARPHRHGSGTPQDWPRRWTVRPGNPPKGLSSCICEGLSSCICEGLSSCICEGLSSCICEGRPGRDVSSRAGTPGVVRAHAPGARCGWRAEPLHVTMTPVALRLVLPLIFAASSVRRPRPFPKREVLGGL